jgi:hypothetical protein
MKYTKIKFGFIPAAGATFTFFYIGIHFEFWLQDVRRNTKQGRNRHTHTPTGRHNKQTKSIVIL